MKLFNFDLAQTRKEFKVFHLKNYCFPIMVVALMLTSCKEAKPQSPKERKEAKEKIAVNDVGQFYLGAIKMCLDTDYNQYFGDYREVNHFPREGNCCTGLVPPPYIDPYEFYLVIMEDEKSLYANHANPFEMGKIRGKLKDDKEEVRDKAMEIDVTNLVKHTRCMFVKYDMAKEEIKFTSPPDLSFGHSGMSTYLSSLRVNTIGMPKEISLPLDSDKAEELFDYYKENSVIGKLVAYSSINARLTYGLRLPQKNTKRSKLDAVVNKIEFFPQDNWTEKIGEITF